MSVDGVRIDVLKRDEQVRREPARGFDRKQGRKIALDILKDGERDHPFERMEVVVYEKPLLDKAETVQGRMLGGVERKRGRRSDDEEREQIIAEKHERDNERGREDAERPIPIRALRIVLILPSFPFQDDAARHIEMIAERAGKRLIYALFSPGNETIYFGLATQQALAAFQTKNKITPAIGYFGPITRRSVESFGGSSRSGN